MSKPPNLDECIKHDGKRPEHIAPDTLVQLWHPESGWSDPKKADYRAWNKYNYYRLAPSHLPDVSNDQLIDECEKRGMIVTKPLVTQAERDRLADALEAAGILNHMDFRKGYRDNRVRAFIDTYETKS